MASKILTDNAHLKTKIKFRLKFLLAREYNVIDAFCGRGLVWDGIASAMPEAKLNILRIDQKADSRADVVGDNVEILKSLDLSKFDIIDLDSYGVPYKQLEEIFRQKARLEIFFTFAQVLWRTLPKKLLAELGYTESVIESNWSLCSKNGFGQFKQYLAKHGIKNVAYVEKHDQQAYRYYGYINTAQGGKSWAKKQI